MSTTGQPQGSGRRRPGIVVRTTLAILVLVPLAVLFTQSWQTASDTVSRTTAERDGITFLRIVAAGPGRVDRRRDVRGLGEPVDLTALDKRPCTPRPRPTRRYGDELQTHSRWANFITSVNHLRTSRKLPPIDEYNAYGAVSDLLLDVYERIRDRSGLVRDQEPDVFFLEDAAVRALPAGRRRRRPVRRLDHRRVHQRRCPPRSPRAERLDLPRPARPDADDVGDDVSDAVDATASQNLSQPLLAPSTIPPQCRVVRATRLTPVTREPTSEFDRVAGAGGRGEHCGRALSGPCSTRSDTRDRPGQRGQSTERLEVGVSRRLFSWSPP